MNNIGIAVSGSHADLQELYDAFISVIGGEGQYIFDASSRTRVLGVCKEIRLAYLGKRDAFTDDHNIPCYTFRILWPEAVFVAAVLDNFVLLAEARRLYANRLPQDVSKDVPTVAPNHIAFIHFFQALVWNELERIIGEWQVRAIFGEYNELRKVHFKFPQLDGYCTQWLDFLNTKYLFSSPENRGINLASTLKQLFLIDEGYLAMKDAIAGFAEREGILVTGVGFSDCLYPDKIEW